MKVVIDSNIIIADFEMGTDAFIAVLENTRNGRINLCIPEVVIDEVLNKFRQVIEKPLMDLTTAIARLRRYTRKNIEISVGNEFLQEAYDEYSLRLLKRIAENNVHIIPYPNTLHKNMAYRAMSVKRPFNSNEKGYRDSLIWENLKEIITYENVNNKTEVKAIFITMNTKDFMSEDDLLHEDLVKELVDLGFESDSLIVYKSLSDFVKEHCEV